MSSEDVEEISIAELKECYKRMRNILNGKSFDKIEDLKMCRADIDNYIVSNNGKKRDILPAIQSCILALTNMSTDAAKLEYGDSDQCSRRLKAAISKFKQGELNELTRIAIEVREQMRMRPRRAYNLTK